MASVAHMCVQKTYLYMAVSGTGFMVSKEVLLENEGWKQHLLLEDVEFTADSILAGRKITYVHAAVLYDEQPVRFGQSFRQKLRWAKGYLQILHKYFGKLFRAIFRKGGFSAYDMLMNITPAYLLTLATVLVNVAGIVSAIFVERMEALEILRIIGTFLFGLYWFAFRELSAEELRQKELEDTIQMLTDCLLEMSELIYS